ncbi:hypothetical protein JD844_005844 [Phrynosoma platyrhinos]|uniref:Suppressor of white apricot N-terminal domain-containing protein n=1 Tax=Phrynosoma platyrhinos TaxID=52577 RepID=A0ABQ7TNY4_PHRPL|nr:hypothetical protein JD844_005844 [Phrynosoma platyrhinos]
MPVGFLTFQIKGKCLVSLKKDRMWHEARKHERKLRGMMVDYKKRAERRREYYEKIVHLDSAVALAAESPVNMMPWQGDTNNMIDRFDVRAHLDYIPMYTPPLLNPITPEQESDERKCNYERYRGLVQNDFAGISEEQCLYQIYIDELYGGLQKPNEDEKKKLAEKKASIGYTYEDSTVAELENPSEKRPEEEDSEEDSNTDEDEVIPDIGMLIYQLVPLVLLADVEVDVDELNQEQVADLNKQATTYGMAEGDFVRMLRKDKEEAEAIKHAKALEEEKAMYSGRRSRRQRREFREKRLKGRKISPPSYARRDSPTYDPYKRSPSESTSESRSRSRSPSPGHEEKITFITSFGGSDEEATASQAGGAPRKAASLGKARSGQVQQGSAAAGHSASSRSVIFAPASFSQTLKQRPSGGQKTTLHLVLILHVIDIFVFELTVQFTVSPGQSHSRSGERYRWSSGRGGRHWSSSRSSRSDSELRSRSRSASPAREKQLRPAASPAVGEKLKKAETAGGKETGAAKVMSSWQLAAEREDELRREYSSSRRHSRSRSRSPHYRH